MMKKRITLLLLALMMSATATAQWTRVTNGLPAQANVGAVTRIGTTLFAVQPIGIGTLGVFSSSNDGTSWTQTARITVENPTIGPDVGAKIYVSGTTLLLTTTGSGVYRSTNNGATWTQSNAGLPTRTVFALLVLPNRVLIGTNAGVYGSTNNGQSWALSNQGIPLEEGRQTRIQAFALGANNSVIAGGDGGAYRSTDNGTSWSAVKSRLTRANGRALAVLDFALSGGTKGMSDEDIEKYIEEERKKGTNEASLKIVRETLKGGATKLSGDAAMEPIEGLGDAAEWSPKRRLLRVLHKTINFSITLDYNPDENKVKAIELAREILKTL